MPSLSELSMRVPGVLQRRGGGPPGARKSCGPRIAVAQDTSGVCPRVIAVT